MFHSADVKCEICGYVMMPSPIFDDDQDKEDLCDECKKAVQDALEQARYLAALGNED